MGLDGAVGVALGHVECGSGRLCGMYRDVAVCVCVCVCVYLCICVCMCMCMCVYMYVCIKY